VNGGGASSLLRTDDAELVPELAKLNQFVTGSLIIASVCTQAAQCTAAAGQCHQPVMTAPDP
jgi:hypothetical protein